MKTSKSLYLNSDKMYLFNDTMIKIISRHCLTKYKEFGTND